MHFLLHHERILLWQIQQQLAQMLRLLQEWRGKVQDQQQQNGAPIDPKIQKELALTQARVEVMMAQAQAKAQIEAQKNQQRLQQSDQRFKQDQQQKEEDHIAGLRGELQQGQVDTAIKDAKAAADIQNERRGEILEPEE